MEKSVQFGACIESIRDSLDIFDDKEKVKYM